MDIIPKPVRFEWDRGNVDKSFSKHGVTSEEAEEIFTNKPLIVDKDLAHSKGEDRFYSLGTTDKERRLFVSFTVRRDKIRIISTRPMSRRERRIYGEET